MDKQKVAKISGWVLTGVVGALFILAGAGKLTGGEMARQEFVHWGYSTTFMYIIGVLEVLGGIGLIVPTATLLAALGLGCLMLGAVYTHAVNDPIGDVLRPVIFLMFLGLVIWIRRSRSKTLRETT
jgi:uncharacterized membrane protein YphA (DoxX/SURF4 family)